LTNGGQIKEGATAEQTERLPVFFSEAREFSLASLSQHELTGNTRCSGKEVRPSRPRHRPRTLDWRTNPLVKDWISLPSRLVLPRSRRCGEQLCERILHRWSRVDRTRHGRTSSTSRKLRPPSRFPTRALDRRRNWIWSRMSPTVEDQGGVSRSNVGDVFGSAFSEGLGNCRRTGSFRILSLSSLSLSRLFTYGPSSQAYNSIPIALRSHSSAILQILLY
jgi:hypothetical protein